MYMLPVISDNGQRLAALSETALQQVVSGEVKTAVMIVVDGLGWANLKDRLAHAPNLRQLSRKRIETVAPSTTCAAITAFTTGVLPGQHGLIGYRIKNPSTGTITKCLSDWGEIERVRDWQPAETVFERAAEQDVNAYAIGRPNHAHGGFTRAVLTGAHYLPAATITDRFAEASELVRQDGSKLIYLYVDELDRAGHKFGPDSNEWAYWLEQFDTALGDFLRSLPGGIGVLITADHGMLQLDPAVTGRVLEDEGLTEGVEKVGGEPRFRMLYLADPADAAEVTERLRNSERKNAWVGTRQDWISTGLWGSVADEVARRIGDVVLVPRKRILYMTRQEEPGMFNLLGHHGGFDDVERGVPVITAGAFQPGQF